MLHFGLISCSALSVLATVQPWNWQPDFTQKPAASNNTARLHQLKITKIQYQIFVFVNVLNKTSRLHLRSLTGASFTFT
jgi:hypothetical protein